MRLFLHELRNQQRLFWRNRESAVFVFIFPPMLYLLLGAVYSGKIDGFPAADVLLVGLIGYGCANTAFAGLAITLVIRRESGVLKRIRATPLPPATYLAAVLCSTLVVFVLQMLVTIALGLDALRRAGPRELARRSIAAVLLGVGCFAGLGFGAAALIRSVGGRLGGRQPDRAADGVPLGLVRPDAPLPGGAAGDRGRAAADLPDPAPQGRLPARRSFFDDPKEIAILVAWGLVGVLIAWRRFGWEPRER